jgi:hypothetical protein
MIAQMRCCLRTGWLVFDIVRNGRVASQTPQPLIKRQCSTLQLLKRQLLGMSTKTAPPAHIKTRFLILSDTHSAEPSQNLGNGNVSFRPPVPRADVLLHCGDLTMIGHLEEYEKTLGMLESIEADLKLVIAGNHDITLDGEYYARKGQYMHGADGYDKELPAKAKEMWMGERAKRAGVTYLEEGTYTFKLKNGANLRVCPSFRIPKSLRLTTEGLRISVPARILRLGVPLLPQPRPLQPLPPVYTKRCTHRREPRPRLLPPCRRDDDPRSASRCFGCNI